LVSSIDYDYSKNVIDYDYPMSAVFQLQNCSVTFSHL